MRVNIDQKRVRTKPFIGLWLALSIGLALPAFAQQPLTLREALIRSQAGNPQLRTIRYDSAAARADVITAGLKPNPVLNNQTLQLLQPAYFAPETAMLSGRNRQTWFQLTKVFQTAHKREHKVEAAGRLVSVSGSNIGEFSRNLLFDVANQWLNVWLLQENLKLIREVRANTDTLVTINRVRLRNQVITPTELIRTQALSEQYQLAETNAVQSYRNELLNLKLLMGSNDTLPVADNDSLDLEQFDAPLDSLLRAVVENRTDVVLAKSSIRAADAQVVLQKALAKPDVEAGVIYNPQNGVHYAGVYFTVPIPLYDRNQGEVQRAQVLRQQTQSQLETVQVTARTQVQVAYQAFQTQRQNIRKSEDIQAKTQQVLNTVRYAYLKGNTTIIDFLDAQRTFFDTQLALNEAYFNLKRSYIQLLYTSGLITEWAR